MSAVDLNPYWPVGEDWAGFILLLVPAGPLAVVPEELRRRVRRQIETDAVLYDLVTVALAPTYEPDRQWDNDLLASVVEAAMPDRHFFAPCGLIGLAVLSDSNDDLKRAVAEVHKIKALRQLGVQVFSAGIPANPRAAMSSETAQRIATIASMLIEDYEQNPSMAVAERAFLERVAQLIEHEGLSVPSLVPESPEDEQAALPPSSTVYQSKPAMITAAQPSPPRYVPPSHSSSLVWQSEPVPQRSSPPPSPSPPLPTAPPKAPSRPPLVEPVVYNGAEIVVVDSRTPREKLLGQHRTDGQTMDDLVRDGRAVALVYLVFVADDGAVTRAVTKSRNTIALELDQLLASVDRDALSGRRAHVAVEVLAATNPMRKYGILRQAGELSESMLPEVPIEYFDFPEAVDPLVDAAARTERAIRARGVEVASVHFIFVAGTGFPADEVTEGEWMRLLDIARVTWIDFSPSQRRQAYRMPPSPYGLHVLTDKEDVVAVIKRQSEVLYRYATAKPMAIVPKPEEEPVAKARRWFNFRKGTQEP